jgi:hypothetical protein
MKVLTTYIGGDMSQPMSERQYRYLRSLVESREYNTELPVVRQLEILDESYEFMRISSRVASTMIDKAKASPLRGKSEVSEQTPLEDGIYFRHGVYYKLVHAVHGSGRQYVKKFNDFTETWDYAPGAVSCISPTTRLTEDQAKKFGKLYGRCVVCGRTLTDEDSIGLGIGPVCREKTFGR